MKLKLAFVLDFYVSVSERQSVIVHFAHLMKLKGCQLTQRLL